MSDSFIKENLQWRVLNRTPEGQEYGLLGAGCQGNRVRPPEPETLREMAWICLALFSREMWRRKSAILSKNVIYTPLNYPPQSIATLAKDKRRPLAQATFAFHDILHVSQTPKWKCGGHFSTWLATLPAYAQNALPYGHDGLAYNTDTPTAHDIMQALSVKHTLDATQMFLHVWHQDLV